MSEKKRRCNTTLNRKKMHKKNEINFDDVIENLKNINGRVRTIEENVLIVQALAYFQKNNMSFDQACKECCLEDRSLWKYFEETGELNIS